MGLKRRAALFMDVFLLSWPEIVWIAASDRPCAVRHYWNSDLFSRVSWERITRCSSLLFFRFRLR
jgi:hypothetical protein